MITRWPRSQPFTATPRASIVPVTSHPLTWGSPSGGGKRPSSSRMSTWLSAHAFTRDERERGRRIDADQDVVETIVTAEDDLELVDVGVGAHQLFHATRVDDHATDLLHVVEPREHAALERHERAAARAGAIGQLDEVAGAVADERH